MHTLPPVQPVAALHGAPLAQQPPSRRNLYYIGRNRLGHWVVRDAAGRSGGVFIDRAHAIKFAMFENGRDPQAVIMVPGVLELDLK